MLEETAGAVPAPSRCSISDSCSYEEAWLSQQPRGPGKYSPWGTLVNSYGAIEKGFEEEVAFEGLEE